MTVEKYNKEDSRIYLNPQMKAILTEQDEVDETLKKF